MFARTPQRLLFSWLVLSAIPGFASNAQDQESVPPAIVWESKTLDREFFGEGASAGDINGDGVLDIVSGPYWYAGPTYEVRHAIYTPKPFNPHGYSDNFFVYVDDFNGDRRNDVLVIGFPGQAAYWFANPGNSTDLWERHLVLDIVDNESPTYADLTGDGQREIVCSREGFFGYATPDKNRPDAPWKFHPISDKSAGGRFTHGLGIGDVNGDGRADLLEKSGWWEQPESLADGPTWVKHPVEFSGAGGSQMFTTDVDGDGDLDVIAALMAHGYGIAWFEQQRQGDRVRFEKHLIIGSQPAESEYNVVFSQPHAVALADIDGDGIMDFVSGKRPWAHGPHGDAEPNGTPVVYWFRGTRTQNAAGEVAAEFVPYKISEEGGVGVDVQLHDLDGDGLLDVVVGSKQGTFVHRQLRQPQSASEFAKRRPFPRRAAATRLPTNRLPTEGLEPAAAAKSMTVPQGFTVDLIAGEPNLHQPVAFCFDTKGRIWVAEAHTYPKRAPEGEGQDKILILEDQDHDGTFETQKVFADHLNLVSGLEVGFGGVWVGAAPYLLFIPDANGDDKPDSEPQILLDGFGFQDTHETLNAFTWGPDGWLYGCHGVFTHSRVGKPGSSPEDRVGLNAGVWRYHPTSHSFEVFSEGTSNPWGLDFDAYGQAFITACVIPHAYHMIQGGRYQRQGGTHFNPYCFDDLKTIADHAHYAGSIRDHAWWGRDSAVDHDATSNAGGGHAHCGGMIYQGDNWPESYRGGLFMANIHGNRINEDLLCRSGSGFICSHGPDFLFANDPWFRGIAIKYGPDGAVYMIDWYDKNACHRTQPETWDRTNGRMFRVRYGDLVPAKIDLPAATDDALVALHQSSNQWLVRAARRVLQERHSRESSNISLRDATRDSLWQQIRVSPQGPSRFDALMTCHILKPISDQEAIELLDSDDENIRAWAIQLTLEDRQVAPDLLGRFVELAKTEGSWRVRLYLTSALQRLPLDQRWELATALMSHPDSQYDANLPLMIWFGVEPLVAEDAARALNLANSCPIPQVRQFIFRRAAVDPKLVDLLVNHLADSKDEKLQALAVMELRGAAEKLGRIPMPKRWPDVVQLLAASKENAVRQAIQFLSISFGDRSLFSTLRSVVADRSASPEMRSQAFSALLQGKDEQLGTIALGLLDDAALQRQSLAALAQSATADSASEIIKRLEKWPSDLQALAVETLVARPESAHVLLNAVQAGTLPRGMITAIHVSKIQELGDPKLLEKLNDFWGTIRATPEEIRQQITLLKKSHGPKKLASQDRSAGRELFAKSCGTCHKLFGEGSEVGPDLTGANRSNLDYLLENILDPNAVVGKDYQTVSVLTEDGRVVSGLIREDSAAAIVIHDAQKLVTIPRSEIETISPTKRSLMPEGLLKPLLPEQVGQLLAYLQSTSQVPLPGQGPVLNQETGRVGGALEAEVLARKATGGKVQNQGMGGFKADRWSGNEHLWWVDGKVGDKLEVTFEVAKTGAYEIFVAMTKAHDYGQFSLAIDGKVAVPQIDLYHQEGVVSTGPVSLGKHVLDAGKHRLEAQIIGSNPQAIPRSMFGLDYIYLSTSERKD